MAVVVQHSAFKHLPDGQEEEETEEGKDQDGQEG